MAARPMASDAVWPAHGKWAAAEHCATTDQPHIREDVPPRGSGLITAVHAANQAVGVVASWTMANSAGGPYNCSDLGGCEANNKTKPTRQKRESRQHSTTKRNRPDADEIRRKPNELPTLP